VLVNSITKLTTLVFVFCFFAIAILGTKESAASQHSTCDLFIAPGGSDQNDGSKGAPLKSFTKLVDQLKEGQTGCFRKGRYLGQFVISNAPEITLQPYPKEKVTLRGHLRIDRNSPGVTIKRLKLNGKTPERHLGPLIYADQTTLKRNTITNEQTAICVHLARYYNAPPPQGVRIVANRIHHCGRLPATNHDHGIYIAAARNTLISRNIIYRNADRGIQLYPDAKGTLITKNIIDRNGQGIIFGGSQNSRSVENTVTKNIITNSRIRFNLESHWPSQIGFDNKVMENCFFTGATGYYSGELKNSGISPDRRGFSAFNNKIRDPLYINARRGNYRLSKESPCRGLLR
jgi:parallel beta-helix repeat protein